ncbi:MAG TPA: hypothetical protein VH328_13775 [Burkholderiaceae bacterium]|jgi:ABC-type uncharacterized transport system substrate-binding protein|nr:hypothetical protein [Burkholderiaceae bacterium]
MTVSPPPRNEPRPLTRRDLLRALAALALGLPADAGAAGAASGPATAGAELRIVTGVSTEATAEIVGALTRRFASAVAGEDMRLLAARSGAGLYLAVGPAALQAALNADVPGTVVSAFVSSEAFRRLRASVPARTRPLTGVYAEASPAAQMQLIHHLYRRRVTVGVLLGAASRQLQPAIERAADAADLAVSFVEVHAGENPVRSLAALSSASVLLAVPDPELYNAEVARAILESTYRRRQGVIGFSKSMVSAGMLGAAYATLDDIVAQLDVMIEGLLAGQVIEPQYPSFWRVAINESVARSLDITVDAGTRALGNFPG